MRNETIAIHGGFRRTTRPRKPVAVPIYQTAAYAFDSADHGAALFNLEAEGFRYSRIANPTSRCWRSASPRWKAGIGALARRDRPGGAALRASSTLADIGGNIVSVPQLYGTTHTLLRPRPAAPGHPGRFAAERHAPTTSSS